MFQSGDPARSNPKVISPVLRGGRLPCSSRRWISASHTDTGIWDGISSGYSDVAPTILGELYYSIHEGRYGRPWMIRFQRVTPSVASSAVLFYCRRFSLWFNIFFISCWYSRNCFQEGASEDSVTRYPGIPCKVEPNSV